LRFWIKICDATGKADNQKTPEAFRQNAWQAAHVRKKLAKQGMVRVRGKTNSMP
jgi:hypothetical protein